jgi:hypothetical protein
MGFSLALTFGTIIVLLGTMLPHHLLHQKVLTNSLLYLS